MSGLAFAAALDKPGGFLGRDAVVAKKARGPLTRRLVQVILEEPEPLLFHVEPVLRDGVAVGYIRSASYGFTLGAGSLPSGITLANSGALSGTSNEVGTFNIAVTATDANGQTGSRAYTLTIAAPTLSMSPAASGTLAR